MARVIRIGFLNLAPEAGALAQNRDRLRDGVQKAVTLGAKWILTRSCPLQAIPFTKRSELTGSVPVSIPSPQNWLLKRRPPELRCFWRPPSAMPPQANYTIRSSPMTVSGDASVPIGRSTPSKWGARLGHRRARLQRS